MMNAGSPSPVGLLPADRVPAMQTVRAQLSASLLAGIADYVPRAATLSHREAVATLRALCAQLPANDATSTIEAADAPPPVTAPSVADDAAHDRYFRIYRVQESAGTAFVRTILTAAALFHAEMQRAYGPADAAKYTAVGAGLTVLLARIAALHLAPVDHSAAEMPSMPATIDPMERWVLGHQIFAALTQGIVFALQEFEAAVPPMDRPRACHALSLAADLLLASAAAFRFTADFPPAAYRDVVRPSMMAQQTGLGFSGLLSVDHRQLVTVLTRVKPLMTVTRRRFAAERKQLTRALNHVYENHKFVCAQFDGAKVPSLLCPSSSPLPGVEQLDRYQRARVCLLRPGSSSDDPLIV